LNTSDEEDAVDQCSSQLNSTIIKDENEIIDDYIDNILKNVSSNIIPEVYARAKLEMTKENEENELKSDWDYFMVVKTCIIYRKSDKKGCIFYCEL